MASFCFAFSFLLNSLPIELLMPFFFWCLCKESWLLAVLLPSVLLSAWDNWLADESSIVRLKENRYELDKIAKLCLLYLSWIYLRIPNWFSHCSSFFPSKIVLHHPSIFKNKTKNYWIKGNCNWMVWKLLIFFLQNICLPSTNIKVLHKSVYLNCYWPFTSQR